jgi:hypothetical protein
LPHAWVWTYGYNADVIEGLFEASNKNSIIQHRNDLIAALERDIDNKVPFTIYTFGDIEERQAD